MEEDGGAMVQTNNGFARKLGSADKKTRDKGLALLVLWLSCQQDVREEELKKIWKGLFYCVWHSDKALVQADLINKLAGTLENLDMDVSLSFFKVFLTTIRREWGGIDRLRLDKFYLLLRQFLVRVFVILQKSKWDEEVVGKFMDALVERTLLASDEYPALGVNLHLMDIFLGELRKCQPLSAGTFRLLLQPCYATLASVADKTLMKRVKETVFEPLLEDAKVFVKSKQAGIAVNESSFGPHVILLSLGAQLFELASSESTPQANRKMLYEIHSEYVKLDKLVAAANLDLISLTGGDTEMAEVKANGGVRHSSRNVGKKDKKQEVVVGSVTDGKKRKAKDVSGGSKKSKESPVLKDSKAMDEVVSNLETKKDAKQGSVKQQKRLKKSERLSRVETGEQSRGPGAGMKDVVQKETMSQVSEEKKKKPKKKVQTEIAQIQSLKKKKKTGSVENGKSSLVQAVQTGGTLEVTKQKLVITNVGDAKSRDGEQLQSRVASSPTAQLSGEAGELSGMRDADSLINVSVDDSVISNLEEKFASISEFRSSDLLGEASPVKSLGKKKRKRANNVVDSELSIESTPGTGQFAPTPMKSNGVDQTPGSNSAKKKKVRFVLKNNIVWKPHNPLPPQSMRTPPSATPRGSALKKGVPAGPIRVTPTRKAIGSPARRRSPSQILSISKQKPSRSPKSLSKGPRFTRRVKKSPGTL